jgi:hypothetical protein
VLIDNSVNLAFLSGERISVYCTGAIEDPVVSLHVSIDGGVII